MQSVRLLKHIQKHRYIRFNAKAGNDTFEEVSENSEGRSIFNLDFGVVCLSSMLFSASYNMLIPELPAYLSGLGGENFKGLIISLFTLTAGLSRPVSGRLADSIGRKPVMLFGTIVCVICGLLYPVLGTVAGFLLLRLFHGFSTGFNPTAIAAYVSDVVPQKRLGEAIGWQSLFFGMGMALGPALGSLIKLYYSYNVLFFCSALVAGLSFALIFRLRETLAQNQSFKLRLLKISPREIFSVEAIPPAVLTFLTYLSFGVILTLIPDWSEHLGIVYKGLFFVVFTISSLAARMIAGKASDRHGRVPVIYVGLSILVIALTAIGLLRTAAGLVIGSAVYGLAMGILSPALNAWTIDLSNPTQKGRAIATMFIGMEAGIGIGALVSGLYYRNVMSNIPNCMFVCAMAIAFAIFYLIFSRMRVARQPDGTTIAS